MDVRFGIWNAMSDILTKDADSVYEHQTYIGTSKILHPLLSTISLCHLHLLLQMTLQYRVVLALVSMLLTKLRLCPSTSRHKP